MNNAILSIPEPLNEPIQSYAPGDAQRTALKVKLNEMESTPTEIPLFIDGKEVRTGKTFKVVMPHAHDEVLGTVHAAGPSEIEAAIQASLKARPAWEAMPWTERAKIFLKAADLLAGPYRDVLNSATMLGQSKNVYQAEIDSACELVDFLRFNCHFYEKIIAQQPISPPGVWNQTEYRGLEGFVFAITPFNFTAIAGNLCAAPALCGNTVVWKPSSTQMFAAHFIMKIYREAGLPEGVINMIPGSGAEVGERVLASPHLAGVHFTGSTETFRSIYKTVADRLSAYRTYPRLVGETGGKDFVFADPTADIDAVRTALVRGAFEYQGQKCSAASRAYIPRSLWTKLKPALIADVKSLKIGDVRDFSNFVNAVIDAKAFKRISEYIALAKSSSEAEVIVGGGCHSEEGYFVEPTVIETRNPRFKTMVDEIFGPVLSIYVYEDRDLEATLTLCDESTAYALTGAIFSQDRSMIVKMGERLRHAAGNFYINDKPTGAVVGQQPFGGARASGTNDKSGSAVNLYRWISPRSIKENFVPPTDYRYPFMKEA